MQQLHLPLASPTLLNCKDLVLANKGLFRQFNNILQNPASVRNLNKCPWRYRSRRIFGSSAYSRPPPSVRSTTTSARVMVAVVSDTTLPSDDQLKVTCWPIRFMTLAYISAGTTKDTSRLDKSVRGRNQISVADLITQRQIYADSDPSNGTLKTASSKSLRCRR